MPGTMTFVDIVTGRRYLGRLEQEKNPGGLSWDVLVLTTVEEKERRLIRSDRFQYYLCLLDGTLDDVARLDRAGFYPRLGGATVFSRRDGDRP